jgi:hypothetical protein
VTERLIAIGDIHGCSAALAALVRAIDPSALAPCGNEPDLRPAGLRDVILTAHLQFVRGCRNYFETEASCAGGNDAEGRFNSL